MAAGAILASAGGAMAQDITLTVESWRNDDLAVWRDKIIPWSHGLSIISIIADLVNPKSATIPVCSPTSASGPARNAWIVYRCPWRFRHFDPWSTTRCPASIPISRDAT